MAKNDFDIDFNFDEEFDFDPNTFLDGEELDSDIDLTQFSDEELGLSSNAPEEEPEADYSEADYSEAEYPEEDEELPYDPLEGFPREEPEYAEEEYPEEEVSEESYPEEEDVPVEEPQQYEEEEVYEKPKKKAKKVKPPKEPKPKKPKKEIQPPKFLLHFYDLYFAPLTNKALMEEPQDPNKPRRRRKSKQQIFKEFYLPPILVGICAVLVLSFAMGAVSNLIAEHNADAAIKKGQLESSISAAEQEKMRYQQLMDEAAELANSYDYQGAVGVLESFGDMSAYPEMVQKHAEYLTIQSRMVEHKDPSMIPNLSFHVLMNDVERAKQDKDLGGKYNKNFVTVGEFTNILSSLYNKGYVLVDFDSFIATNTSVDGTQMYDTKPIYLPEGKKPIMLTETMVNYFNYMVDSNDDKKPDKDGDSFANRLVVQNGEIKAAYIDPEGNELIGDYDFVPILESFIKAHPDFVYQGARATLAVTGEEGVWGYRVNSSYINSVGATYQEEQVARAKEVTQALRDKGYRIACFTYGNKAYKNMTATQIQADIKDWATQITPVIGPVDTLIFAQTSDLADYTGPAFTALYTEGFRFFVSNLAMSGNDTSWAEVNSSFVRQKRLMVTGQAMAWHSSRFADMFDCNAILESGKRGNVPND